MPRSSRVSRPLPARRLLTLTEAAKALGIPYEAAYRLMLRGRLVRLCPDGYHWRITPASVRRYRAEHAAARAGARRSA